MRKTSITLLALGVFLILYPRLANAQCKPGDDLIGEDQYNYYCSSPASGSDIEQIQKNIDDILQNGPNQYLGEEWRFRQNLINTMGCLAKKRAKYEYGAKIDIPKDCENSEDWTPPVDCSGSVEYASRFAAFAVKGRNAGDFNVLKGMENNAEGQMLYFKDKKAFIPPEGHPTPGDLIFFKETLSCKNKKYCITHVGVYLGVNSKGEILMIHASYNKNRVIITPMPGYLKGKIYGYGNVSRLYMNVK